MSDLQFCIADRPRFVVEINTGLLGHPTARRFDWCEGEGRWMKTVWGGLSGDQGRLHVVLYLPEKSRIRKAAPVWIEIQTQSAY